jgi:hypothetical protein
MENNRKLFDYIGNSMKDYSVKPNDKSWQKIEIELKNGRQSKRRLMYMRLAIAAVMLLAVSVMIYWQFKPLPVDSSTMDIPKPTSLQELPLNPDCHPYCLVLQFRNELPGNYAHPVVKTI